MSASSSEGVFSDDYAQLDIYLQPHWYETWWAYLLYFFAIVGLGFVGLRFQYKRQQLRNQLQLEKMERNSVIELNAIPYPIYADNGKLNQAKLTKYANFV